MEEEDLEQHFLLFLKVFQEVFFGLQPFFKLFSICYLTIERTLEGLEKN